MQYIWLDASNIEFDLATKLEGSLFTSQVTCVDADGASGDVFEQLEGELEEQGHIKLTVDSHFAGKLVFWVVVLAHSQEVLEVGLAGV